MTLRLFKASFRDISRPNRFLVWMPGMPIDLVAHCIGVTMPGTTFSTNATYDPKHGQNVIPWELPYDILNGECTMTFMIDFEYRIKSYFDRWRDEVFDPKRGFGYLEGPDGYGKDVKIFQLSRQNIPTYTMTLTNAWPKSVTEISFDAAAQNTMTLLTVNLVYGGQRTTDTLGWILDKIGVDRPWYI